MRFTLAEVHSRRVVVLSITINIVENRTGEVDGVWEERDSLLREEKRKIVRARENCRRTIANFENRGFTATSRERSATNGCGDHSRRFREKSEKEENVCGDK